MLWGTILVLIVLAFVVYGTKSGSSKEDQAARSPGTIAGEPVSRGEWRAAHFNAYLAFKMMSARMGIPLENTEKLQGELNDQDVQLGINYLGPQLTSPLKDTCYIHEL